MNTKYDNRYIHEPKKFYVETEKDQEQIKQEKLDIENDIRKYKYFNEIPKYNLSGSTRISYGGLAFKESLLYAGISYFFARFSAQIMDYDQRSASYYRRKGVQGMVLFLLCQQVYYRYFHPLGQINQRGVYEVQWAEQKVQQILDLEIDMFKEVEEIKKNRGKVSTWEMYKEENKLKRKLDEKLDRSIFKNFQLNKYLCIQLKLILSYHNLWSNLHIFSNHLFRLLLLYY